MATHNPISAVLDWLRKGYPVGVPPKDILPLVALLTRTLNEDELAQAVSQVIAQNPDGDIDAHDVRKAIADVKAAPPVESDVRDVAARLAAAGWPLGRPQEPTADEATANGLQTAVPTSSNGGAAPPVAEADGADETGVIQRVLDWLQAGYPNGVPQIDRIPILALLQRRLTDDEVKQIARQLIDGSDGGPISAVDAQVLITKAKDDLATEDELDRVRSRLAAKGWPLDG